MKETKVISMLDTVLEEEITVAGRLLREGQIVAFPTETVYGLGANALDENAIMGIFEAKGRPEDNPLIVHISDLETLELLIESKRDYVADLMAAFWPGPLTMIFRKSDRVPFKTTGGLGTVAIRMPNHPIALALIKAAGVPVAAPSANISGKPSPTVGKYVVRDMMGRVACIIDGGEVSVGLESTVVDVTGEVPMILRPGQVTCDDIARVVGSCEIDPAILKSKGEVLVAKSPGMKYKHYAPEAKVSVFVGDNVRVLKEMETRLVALAKAHRHVALMVFEEDHAFLSQLLKAALSTEESQYVHFLLQGSFKQPNTLAKQLFRDLREADDLSCEEILIHGVPDEGVGTAIMNRLSKASEGRVFKI